MSGVGECYHGPAPLFFCQYEGNVFTASNGIGVRDGGASSEPQCASYQGPWVRWQVARRNSFAGTSQSLPDQCACVNATSTQSTDIIAEHNVFQCPQGKQLPGGGTNVNAQHSVVR